MQKQIIVSLSCDSKPKQVSFTFFHLMKCLYDLYDHFSIFPIF